MPRSELKVVSGLGAVLIAVYLAALLKLFG